MFTFSSTYQQSVFKQYHNQKHSQRFTYKMAAENSGHRYDTKLRHCHPMYIIIIRLLRIKAAQNTLQNIKRSSSNNREEIKTNRATIPDRFDRLPEW